MATNNFKLKITTEDLDGNTSIENVSVNSGPAECSPPTVTFSFPSGVRAETGDDVDPFWSAGTIIAAVFCKVFPTARPTEGGNGTFLVQNYSTAAKYPDSPDSRFEQTFEGAGGQLAASLTNTATNFMVVSSGTGVAGSGLAQSSDLVGLRKSIHITDDTAITTEGTRVTRFGRTVRVGGREREIGNEDEGISVYHHDLTTDKVYTLERGGRALGRNLDTWQIGASVTLHPYHYVPMYANATSTDVLVTPHIMVQEVGTQYPLTGSMLVSGTSVVGTNTDFLNEISGVQNLIKFGDAEPWYLISGVTSSSGIQIYTYGDTLDLTNQPAQINCYTLGSGTVAILPDLAGCTSWDILLSPQYSTGDTIPSLSVDYTATIDPTIAGGGVDGTPSYVWEVLSGTTPPTWSGLVPGNATTQTVVYESETAKRIRVSVSGSGSPGCVHQYDTGDLSLLEGISAGTWKSVQSTIVGTGGQVESKIRAQQQGSRVADKYYHHHLTAMQPMQTTTTASVTSTTTTIYVSAGTIDLWPNKGTVIIKGPLASSGTKQSYLRFTYTGKTNSSLTGIVWRNTYNMPKGSNGYKQTELTQGSPGTLAAAGSDIWIQQSQPYPFSKIETIVASNKVRLRDVAGINNGSSTKWVRFAPAYHDTEYLTARSGKMIDQPYRIIATNETTREITLDRNLHASIAANMLCVMQPFTDQIIGLMYPSSVNPDRLNFWGLSTFFVYNPDDTSSKTTTVSTSTTTNLYIWDPMYNVITGRSEIEQHLKLAPVGRMIAPQGDSTDDKGVVIEYNGYTGPIQTDDVNGVTGNRPGVIQLHNVKIVSELSVAGTSHAFGSRTMLIPYQDIELTPISVLTFEPTDADIGYDFNGGTSKHLGWSQPLADEVFATSSETPTFTTLAITPIPNRTNYEEQHYPAWPTKAIRSAPPVYINVPLTGDEDGVGNATTAGCIHYDTLVDILEYDKYVSIAVKDTEVGQMIRTPEGPREIVGRLESHYGSTRVLSIRNNYVIHCTHVHPIATLDDNDKIIWKKAAYIEQGDRVMTDIGPQVVNANVSINFSGKTVHPFYDLDVADVHQFYANGILVHNKILTEAPNP